jgi:hypothetical protein
MRGDDGLMRSDDGLMRGDDGLMRSNDVFWLRLDPQPIRMRVAHEIAAARERQ